jgi:hypothetical protein
MVRECGSCTKCCEGWLSGNIRGHDMSPGKPCFFVEIGKGCTDYENRPKDPCKDFLCHWITNENVPENLYPAKSGVIITDQEIKNIYYIKMAKSPNEPTTEDLSWFVTYALNNQLNCAWDTDKQTYWLGSIEFSNAMNNEYGF